MLRWFAVFLVFAVGADELPFWKAKAKVYNRIQDGEVIVSVKDDGSHPPFAHCLKISGGGQVKVPREFALQYAREFDKVARLSGFIDRATYNKEKQLLDVSISAFGHRADLQVGVREDAEREPRRISFEVLKGPMTGLRANLDFASPAPSTTEVGISGEYGYNKFPIPKLFLEFGMEVVFQKMAARLRRQVEAVYRSGASK